MFRFVPLAISASLALHVHESPQCAAASAGKRPRVRWTAPVGCPTQFDFDVLVQREMEEGDSSGDASELEATVFVSQSHGGGTWTADIDVRGQTGAAGHRSFSGATCDEVAAAAALYLALVAGNRAAEVVSKGVQRGAASRWPALGVAMGGAVEHGALPRTTFGARAAMLLRGRRWRTELAYAWWDERRQRHPAGQSLWR